VASLLCGLAPDLPSLIVFRTVQGIGGSLLGANSIMTLIKSTPSDKRARAMGLLTASQAVGLSAGPVVGGILLDTLGWQWVFWAAVPFGVAAVVLGWLVLPQSTDLASRTELDWYGALLLMPSLVLSVLFFNQTSVWPLLSPAMIVSAVAAIVLLALFLRHERVVANPLVDLTLFGANAFTVGIVGVALGYALMYGMFFLMSFALIHGLHESARLVGIKLAVIPIAIGLLAPFAMSLSERWGSRAIGVVGMALCTVATITISGLALHPIGTLISGLSAFAVFGIGLGLFMAPNANATIEAAPASRAGTASALVNLMRALGSCLGISAASSMMSWRMQQLAGVDTFDKVYFEGSRLLDAVESSLAVLVVFALIAAGGLLARPRSAVR
jgi:EmrB/QacA subfamily drug resistance transporter